MERGSNHPQGQFRQYSKIAWAPVIALLAGCASEPRYPEAAYHHTQLGAVYLQQGDLPRAYEKLHRALVHDPTAPAALYTAGVYWERVENMPQAKAHYQAAVRWAMARHQQEGEAHAHYAQFLCRQHQSEAAIAHWLQAAAVPGYPQSGAAYAEAAQCAWAHGQGVAGWGYFERAWPYRAADPAACDLLWIGMAHGAGAPAVWNVLTPDRKQQICQRTEPCWSAAGRAKIAAVSPVQVQYAQELDTQCTGILVYESGS